MQAGWLCSLSPAVSVQGPLGAVLGVPIRSGPGPGEGARVSLWEDEPAVLQRADGAAQPGPAHRPVRLPLPAPGPEAGLRLRLCHR